MYVYIYMCMSAGTGEEHRYIYIYISMRKMGFSNEFVVVLSSIMSLVSALSFMFVIKLLKQMRDSAWNIEFYATMTHNFAEIVAVRQLVLRGASWLQVSLVSSRAVAQ